MTIDEENCHWNVNYPYLDDPLILHDNRAQAKALLFRLEKQLSRDPISTQAYQQEFENFVRRGVLVKIPQDELNDWSGPVNYVSHHPVYKPELFSRISGEIIELHFGSRTQYHE